MPLAASSFSCEPRSIALPPDITMISSISTTDVRRWVEKIMVRPLASFNNVLLIAASVVWSSAEVASSSSRTDGLRTMARAAGQRVAALADRRIVFLRQAHDVAVDFGLARRLLDLLVGCAFLAEPDVFPDRHVEQHVLLEHHG